MGKISEILKSKIKPKEKVLLIADEVRSGKKINPELIERYEGGSLAVKGTCMEAIELVSEDSPETAAHYLDFVVEHVHDEGPRIRWEGAKTIGNLARILPEQAGKAVPQLLLNTKDDGTVVRWSAAFALGEILLHNSKLRTKFQPKVEELAQKETQNGVKNMYLKALKKIEKETSAAQKEKAKKTR